MSWQGMPAEHGDYQSGAAFRTQFAAATIERAITDHRGLQQGIRDQWSHGDPWQAPTITGGGDSQIRATQRTIERLASAPGEVVDGVESLGGRFVDPAEPLSTDPITENDILDPASAGHPGNAVKHLTLAGLRAAAGLHPDGFTRKFPDPSGTGVATAHGLIEHGDYIGPWLWNEIKAALDVLRTSVYLTVERGAGPPGSPLLGLRAATLTPAAHLSGGGSPDGEDPPSYAEAYGIAAGNWDPPNDAEPFGAGLEHWQLLSDAENRKINDVPGFTTGETWGSTLRRRRGVPWAHEALIPNHVPRAVDFYAYSQELFAFGAPLQRHDYDDNGEGLTERVLTLIESVPASTDAPVIGTRELFGWPPEPPAVDNPLVAPEPPEGESREAFTRRGCEAWPVAVVHWDFEF